MGLELRVLCAKGHTQTVPLINASVDEAGNVDGYAGSAADYCDTCEAHIVSSVACYSTDPTAAPEHTHDGPCCDACGDAVHKAVGYCCQAASKESA